MSATGAIQPPLQTGERALRPGASPRGWLLAALALLLLKLWLTDAQTLTARAASPHDDSLFLQLAQRLVHGQWLGDYSQFTLMKGPLFPLWIAFTFLLAVPFLLAQQLLYAGACALVLVALRPWRLPRWLQLAAFALLLFNPITYDAGTALRMIRESVIPALTLLVVAALLGLHARRSWPWRQLWRWAALLGLSLGAFWLTREESVWLLPVIAALWGAALLGLWRSRPRPPLTRLAALLLVPALLWGACIFAVAALNWHLYGLFTTCEFKSADFRDAYGALIRVEPERWQPFIVVPRATREQLYAVSPAFAELRGELEGAEGFSWATASAPTTHLPPQQLEIAGGWFMWALRGAVDHSGYHESGAQVMRYYQRLAREVNEACDSGRLRCGPPRSGFFPPWHRELWDPLWTTLGRAALFLATFEQLDDTLHFSSGSPEWRTLFADLTRARVSPGPEGPFLPVNQLWLDLHRLQALSLLMRGYKLLAPALGLLALGAFAVSLVLGIRRRRASFWMLASAGLLGSIAALLVGISLIEVTSFPAVTPHYLSGAYGLWLLFWLTAGLGLREVLLARSLEPERQASIEPA